MEKTNKYPNGYAEKIEYWNSELLKAIKHNTTDVVDRCMDKLRYFTNKQTEWETANPSKKYARVSVNLIIDVEDDDEDYVYDAISAALTENLQMSGAIVDWGYIPEYSEDGRGASAKVEFLGEHRNYQEGDLVV